MTDIVSHQFVNELNESSNSSSGSIKQSLGFQQVNQHLIKFKLNVGKANVQSLHDHLKQEKGLTCKTTLIPEFGESDMDKRLKDATKQIRSMGKNKKSNIADSGENINKPFTKFGIVKTDQILKIEEQSSEGGVAD